MLASALVIAGPAVADSPEDRAHDAMRRGIAAFARGDAEAALAEYRTALSLVPHANAPYKFAGEALVKLGRYEEAITSFERYLAIKPGVSDAELVRTRIAEIRARFTPGTLRVMSRPVGADVFVDGAEVRVGRTPAEVRAAPGHHVLTLRMPRYRDAILRVDVVGGERTQVVATLEGSPDAASLADATSHPSGRPAAPPAPTSRPISRATWGWLALGVGSAGLSTAVILDVVALQKTQNAFRAAVQAGDSAAAESAKRRFDSERVAGLVAYAAGAAFAATGLVLLAWPGRAGAPPRVTASVAPGGAAATWTTVW